jgi:hypothetical protein
VARILRFLRKSVRRNLDFSLSTTVTRGHDDAVSTLRPNSLQDRKAQSFRKASIAEGVLRRMVVDHGEQLLPSVF